MSDEIQKDSEEEKSSYAGWIGCFVLIIGIVAVLGPNFYRARKQGSLTSCKSNLKNIGSAMEMYSTDWDGKYPSSLDQLTPGYLKTLPECPPAETVTYKLLTGSVAYNNPGFEDYYYIYCAGDNHTPISVPPNYPAYDGISGLIERP